jgi:hypothetical protein
MNVTDVPSAATTGDYWSGVMRKMLSDDAANEWVR